MIETIHNDTTRRSISKEEQKPRDEAAAARASEEREQ